MRKTTFRNFALVGLVCAALSACELPQAATSSGLEKTTTNGVAAGVTSQQTDLDVYARQFLNTIQARSIAESREYCGYFVRSGGSVMATTPTLGTEASCNYGPIPANTVASYHTHGSYGEAFDNEVPSGFDLLSAIEVSFDDYVSTPGGRLWRVDGETGTATQLCGIGCLVADPNFVPRDEASVRQVYTPATLKQRQES